jgi:hypothetical protein
MRFIVEDSDIFRFKYCPYCGSTFFSVYLGDYMGMVQCYDCHEDEEDLDLLILEEYRDRYPQAFTKLMNR